MNLRIRPPEHWLSIRIQLELGIHSIVWDLREDLKDLFKDREYDYNDSSLLSKNKVEFSLYYAHGGKVPSDEEQKQLCEKIKCSLGNKGYEKVKVFVEDVLTEYE